MSTADMVGLPSHLSEGLAPMRKPLATARHLPGYVYTSQEVLELEKERLFMTDWLMICREEEVESPGDYMTFRILSEPVLVCRDGDGELHAFANVCRHRGVEVASGWATPRNSCAPTTAGCTTLLDISSVRRT